MKRVRDFNVRTEADFVIRLLPQGAWTRCTSCSTARQRTSALSCHPGGLGGRPIASPAEQSCAQCLVAKPRQAFWPSDWEKSRARGIKCKECEPRPPHHRPKVPPRFTCGSCGVEKERNCFWPKDIENRHQGLRCMFCCPTPPDKRRQTRDRAKG